MRPGCSHPTSPWIQRQSCLVFERYPTAMGKVGQNFHAIVLTNLKSLIISIVFRDSSGCGSLRGASPLESPRQYETSLTRTTPSIQSSVRSYPIFLYNGGFAFYFRKCFANAFHSQLDLVRWPDINQKDMILPILHQLAQSRFKLCAPPPREATLKNGKLYPLAIPMHGLENPPPPPLIRDVICYDKEAFIGHRRHGLTLADSADRLVTLPAETGTATAPEPTTYGAYSPDNQRLDVSFPERGGARTLQQNGGARLASVLSP